MNTTAHHPGLVSGALRRGLEQPNNAGEAHPSASQAALVLLALGPEGASKLIQAFSPSEAEKVSALIASVKALPRQAMLDALERFKRVTELRQEVAFDSEGFVKALAQKFSESAADFQGSDALNNNFPALDLLANMKPESLRNHLVGEHPQVAATLLSLLSPEQAASVIELFDDDIRDELLLRVALLDKVDPAALTELNEVLENTLREGTSSAGTVGGARTTAEILGMFSAETSNHALEAIRKHDDKLANRIAEQLFAFEDFALVDSLSIQRLIPEVSDQDLVVALKGASPAIRELFMNNMTKRMAERIVFEMESLPPVSVKELEIKQRNIVRIAQALSAADRISLERKPRGS